MADRQQRSQCMAKKDSAGQQRRYKEKTVNSGECERGVSDNQEWRKEDQKREIERECV